MQWFLTGFALFRTQILHLDINTVPKLSKSKIKKYLIIKHYKLIYSYDHELHEPNNMLNF